VSLSLRHDVTATGELAPGERHDQTLAAMLDEVVDWSEALAPLRAGARA
jgi:hypothetical protein